VAGRVAFGIRLYKPGPGDWPAADWAVVADAPLALVDHGSVRPPRSYSEAAALQHLYEAIATRVKAHKASVVFIWGIEGNARLNKTMVPRLRAEGVACAAGQQEGAKASIVVWKTIESAAEAKRAKGEYASATNVCGIAVGEADPQAVLVAVAALRS
jgi:hypothetical protein